MNHELAIIGAGNMAEAIVRGILREKAMDAKAIVAADVSPQRRELSHKELGVAAVESAAQAVGECRMALLSVKPQQMGAALQALGGAISPQTLVISIAAGVTTAAIARGLGGNTPWRIVRAMPNTPMLVGEGMVALCRGEHATESDLADARKLFEPAAEVMDVEEKQMDAVTAVSGSGPAYFYFLVEQMIAAGVELGLSPQQSRQLAIQTAAGTAEMLVRASDSPAELRRKVTSPGGTTQAAITHMESENWPRITREALHAAARRSAELVAEAREG
jgi:pyrroline-5-carboxylate reductase